MTPAADTEIELKLAIGPDTVETLTNAPALVDRARNRGTVRRLESTYFDTADWQLVQRGATLRVRRTGAKFVQTLKTAPAGGTGGAFERGEWEAAIGTAAPDLRLLPEGAARQHLSAIPFDALAPRFATAIRRHRRLVDAVDGTGRPSVIEIAVDQGMITAGDAAATLSEVELELKDGAPEALYRLALELHGTVPMRLETESKSDRGYRLATGAAPPWRKPGPIILPADGTAETALRTVLRACTGTWLANQAAALDGRDPEGVHQMRVALRRFRSALPLFRHLIPPERLSWLKTEAKWVADGLAPARDWDVFLAGTMPPVEAAAPDDPSLAALRRAAGAARDAAYRGVRETVSAPRYTAFLLELGLWLETDGWRAEGSPETLAEPAGALADRLLQRGHKDVRKAGRRFAHLTPEERHGVRIAAKKLRYAVDFFQSLYGGRSVRGYRKPLKRLLAALGHMNDAAVAARLAENLPNGDPALARGVGLVLGWHGHAATVLRPKLASDWDGFKEAKPFWRAGKKGAKS